MWKLLNRWRSTPSSLSIAIALVLSLFTVMVALPQSAVAGIFDKIVREVAEKGGDLGKTGKFSDLDLPDGLGSVFLRLPDTDRDRALMATTTPEGHVRLINAKGEAVTASSSAEITSALTWLLPNASETARTNALVLLPVEGAVTHRAALNLLPPSARLRVVEKGQTFAIVGRPPFAKGPLRVRLRAELIAIARTPATVSEALWQLGRAMKPADLRILSLDTKAAKILPAVRAPVAERTFRPEKINPFGLVDDMSALRGQTVIVTGEIDGGLLAFAGSSGTADSVALADLKAAARRDNVNLVVLSSNTPRQPGVRNLLWQQAEVDGLDAALTSTTLGDFWAALATNRGPLEIDITPHDTTHVGLVARPSGDLLPETPDGDGSLLTITERLVTELVSTATGEIVTRGIEATLLSEAQDRELNRRIVPGIPSDVQILYILASLGGLVGLPTVLRWFRRMRPLKPSSAFASTLGLITNRITRALAFWPLFLPLAGIIAGPYQLLTRPLELVTWPFKSLWHRLRPA
ncbi:MAG: hypothetical protein AAGJ70_08735 [Pseudomonadota bacterium]